MLTRLNISNLATIQSLSANFSKGFSVLSGETGAGKSILLDALRFVLGRKTEPYQVRSGANLTLVEAEFDIAQIDSLKKRLRELQIPFENERIVVRRGMMENGRARAVINDCSVTMPNLAALGQQLVSIHGQHDNQRILKAETHLDFLDDSAGLGDLRQAVTNSHRQFVTLLRKRDALLEQEAQGEKERHWLEGVVTDLQEANLSTEENTSLREENQRLSNVELLGSLLAQAQDLLQESETSLLTQMGLLQRVLAQLSKINPAMTELEEHWQAVHIPLSELHHTVRSHGANLENNPARLEEINIRLTAIEKASAKYGGVEAALQELHLAQAQLEGMRTYAEQRASLDGEVNQASTALQCLCEELSKKRRQASQRLDADILNQLLALGMERAQFSTRVTPLVRKSGEHAGKPYRSPKGMDAVEFLLSANPGQALRSLSQIASGGELSRMMLAMKTILAQADPPHTLIFDEVDTGVSGRIAEIVGRKLKQLGQHHQVLCITHLPQIAALSHQHYQVTKHTQASQTYTAIQHLSAAQHVQEVARLLSGQHVSDNALAAAQDMVHQFNET